jgi:hypothetical protein
MTPRFAVRALQTTIILSQFLNEDEYDHSMHEYVTRRRNTNELPTRFFVDNPCTWRDEIWNDSTLLHFFNFE